MKQVVIFILFVSTLLAEPLLSVDASFSKDVQSKLLQKLNSASSKLHNSNHYRLTEGWNQLQTPKYGIDVVKSFQDISDVLFVVTYDFKSKYWAGFTLEQSTLKDIKEMLLLKYLEPHVSFFILAKQNISIEVKSTEIKGTCENLLVDSTYSHVMDSGLSKKSAKGVGIELYSRYSSHEYRGIYDDTRVMLFYKKIKVSRAITERYGPAEPTVMLHYAKEFENRDIYLYDFLERRCYIGTLPSPKLPPSPVLRDVDK